MIVIYWIWAKLRRVQRLIQLGISYLVSRLFFSHAFPLREVRHILMIRLQHLGDVLLSLPALECLQRAFPQAAIDFLTNTHAQALLAGFPGLHEIITYNSRTYFQRPSLGWRKHFTLFHQLAARPYDLIVDLDGDVWTFLLAVWGKFKYRADRGTFRFRALKSSRKYHQVEVNLKILEQIGLHCAWDKKIQLPSPTSTAQATCRQLLADLKLRPDDFLVILHPGAGLNIRRWPENCFAGIGQWLNHTYGAKVILVGSRSEKAIAQRIQEQSSATIYSLAGQTNVPELMALIQRSRFFIGGDSFPAHVAATAGIPTLILYGPQDPAVFALPFPNVEVVSQSAACSPCLYNNMYIDYCPQQQHCLKTISLEEVQKRITRLWPR